jgi:hypothetical protein
MKRKTTFAQRYMLCIHESWMDTVYVKTVDAISYLKMKVGVPVYWLMYRFHPKHRYHTINCLPAPGYADIDTRMLNAVMNLLIEFNKERLEYMKALDLTVEEYYSENPSQSELDEILAWWNVHPHYGVNSPEVYEQENEMLIRAIRLRKTLWT